MSDLITETMPLGTQWPTLDPFLFCAHHLDHYPEGDGALAPAADLAGRRIGMDFDGMDGWNMYHGSRVPGFPQHPHRGFETVTYVRTGVVDHSDSLGATARFGEGDVQWLTAGGGIVHSEMFPLRHEDRPNPLEIFQIWLNLPAADKMVDPHFTMLWNDVVPSVDVERDGARAGVTVIAGRFGQAEPGSPPPHSWANRDDTDVAIWHLALESGAAVDLPAAGHPESNRVVYLFDGESARLDGTSLPRSTGAVVDATRSFTVEADEGPADLLVLQGRPIGEPVAQYGPFVLNDRAGIQQAAADYQRTQFGGWPWDRPDPAHPADRGPVRPPRRRRRRGEGRPRRVPDPA